MMLMSSVRRVHEVQGKVVVCGEDIDLLVLTVALSSTEKYVLFLKPKKKKLADFIYFFKYKFFYVTRHNS